MNYKSTGHIYEETQSPAVIGINHAIIVVTILAEIQTFITPTSSSSNHQILPDARYSKYLKLP